jgi:hypothetical protein
MDSLFEIVVLGIDALLVGTLSYYYKKSARNLINIEVS